MKLNEILKESAGEFLTDINEIKAWLKRMEIKNYTIRDDGIVDVMGSVDISNQHLSRIPVQFGKVGGNFYGHANALVSLDGSPTHVGEHFFCFSNKLTTLEGGPTHVGGHFSCSTNKLTTLEFLPTKIGGDFLSRSNLFISHTIGLILTGSANLTIKPADDWVPIIEKYLGKPDSIFDCQAELIEQGFEEFAQL